jgi:hypothetical protein
MKRLIVFVCGLCTFLWVTGCAHTQTSSHTYSNDFETGNTKGWSTAVNNTKWQRPIEISATPDGIQHVLGEFGNQNVRFALNDLPAHDSLTVSFDLFVLRSWDGNADPDIWTFSVDDSVMLRTTFSNTASPQAFPGTYANTRADARMGSVANNSLGYTWSDSSGRNETLDSYYRLSFSLPHTAKSVAMNFAAQLKDARPFLSNESWALDNVLVQTSSRTTQEPSVSHVAGSDTKSPGDTPEKPVPSYDLSDVVITMQRGACFGFCPIYTVTIYGNGKVEFMGERFVDSVGAYTDSIAVEEVKKLVHAFHTTGFFTMQDEYTNPHVTDLPSVRTTFSGTGKTKSIHDYYGAPAELKNLEKLIDSIARTQKWIGKGGNK